MQKDIFYNAKGHISCSNMCPFALQFAAYRNTLKTISINACGMTRRTTHRHTFRTATAAGVSRKSTYAP